ncbi:MAG TPA: 5-formyltetrahydrofolate cyclo-ligase [Luteolibacter sp.]
MAIPESSSGKSQLRATLRQRLREHIPDPAAACAALSRWLQAHPALRTIAVYSPLPGEVDLSSVVLARPDLIWVYPRVLGHHLTFHTGGNLLPGSFRILEPTPDCPQVAVQEIDAFLCPGLAFDANGGRLGRGRGFYDRLLAQARPDALKIGICFPFQCVTDTFSEPHDITMDEVLF